MKDFSGLTTSRPKTEIGLSIQPTHLQEYDILYLLHKLSLRVVRPIFNDSLNLYMHARKILHDFVS